MKPDDIERLKYRRQYILAPEKINCPFVHNLCEIGKSYLLYSHIDLNVTQYSQNDVTLVLLGDMFDYVSPDKSNVQILKDLIDNDFNKVLRKTNPYTGRYALIYNNQGNIKIFHDAIAARKVFYSINHTRPWFASQPHLLARMLNHEITQDVSRLSYYNSEDFIRMFNANIGNTTIYDKIFQLSPNHYFDLNSKTDFRFWPNQKITRQPVTEVVEKSAVVIKGYMDSIASRYDIMLPVTAGKDSRLLLAASKNIKDRIFCYTNKDRRLSIDDPDLKIPAKLLSYLNLQHLIIVPDQLIDADFERIYFENNPYANKEFLPFIYNYFLHFGDKVNIPGNTASAGIEYYKCDFRRFTPEKLSRLNGVHKYTFAKDYYINWLSGCRQTCIENNIKLIDLFYWEERLGNWGTQIQMEKDIAQEDINVFNSRLLIELFLSVDENIITPPDALLQKIIIKKLWPELLNFPINPGTRSRIKYILKYLGLLKLQNKIKFSIYELIDKFRSKF